MYFEKLYYIHLLWIVIALAVFLFYRDRKRSAMLEKFASREMLDKLTTRSAGGRVLKIFLFLFGLTFLVLALMEPNPEILNELALGGDEKGRPRHHSRRGRIEKHARPGHRAQ